MPDDWNGAPLTEADLTALRPLARLYPTLDDVLAEIARLSAELTMPKGTVHVISDIHGEYLKLRHILNNASGTLRPVVEELFGDEWTVGELQDFLALLFYPKEALARTPAARGTHTQQMTFYRKVVASQTQVLRALAARIGVAEARRRFPPEYRAIWEEMLYSPTTAGEARRHAAVREEAYLDAVVEALVYHDRAAEFVRRTVHALRRLAIDELIIAGDCWDRGPRGDKVMDLLMLQPNCLFTWGNHDAAWIGACLGNDALIAQVLRMSIRYRRIVQLEEGYGIPMQPLDLLVRKMYADDPAERFQPRGTGLRDPLHVARLQKAAAVLQFKLEGQIIARHPEWELDDRRLLHHLDLEAGTVVVDGKTFPLRDRRFPTIDPRDPYALSPDEVQCLDRCRQSFVSSRTLWNHIRWMVRRGAMYLKRDDHLVFHACVPVDAAGEFLPLEIDGGSYKGRELFDVIERVVVRALDQPTVYDLDVLWYLWSGPRSPLFGKDRITTLENYLLEDPATHVETKNPYFTLIHEKDFCRRILEEFGVDPNRGLIVNGHVPVKVDKGESPLKRSGMAVTIDGAFSQAYGDHGYTLVLEPEHTSLALHHHFESVETAVRDGVDIIPEVTVLRQDAKARLISETEQGDEITRELDLLERLAEAYRTNRLRQQEVDRSAGPYVAGW
ncbi:MAG: fructose-bisphosphatase class III [Planctomycetia bacterium]